MVSVQVGVGLGLLVLLLSLGAVWMDAGSSNQSNSSTYGLGDFDSNIGSYYTGNFFPDNSTFASYSWGVFIPLLVSPPLIPLLLWAILPLTFIFTVVAIFRWKYSLVAGFLGVLSGAAWIAGVALISQRAAEELPRWIGFQGRGGSFTVVPSTGAYMAVLGGAALLCTWFLARAGKLEVPFD